MLKINLIHEVDDVTKPMQKVIKKVLKVGYRYEKLRGRKIINVILVNNQRIHEVNLQYRHIDRPTDVISFENQDSALELGDIFISIEQCLMQAQDYGHSFERELAFLSIHGFLHCLGYDHLTQSEEEEMIQKQNEILNLAKYTRV